MSAYPVWKILVAIALIVLPGTLLLLPLFLAHRKFAQRALIPLPRAINGRAARGRDLG
jgi:hypothetical protein